MKKILLISWKDLTLAFRDRAALILMLAAPFVLTLGLGFVTGRFSGASNSGISNIPVILVNQDHGQLGDALVSLFQSPELSGLIAAQSASDPAKARQAVDQDQAAAAIIVPAGFTRSILPAPGATAPGPLVQVELYANPTRPNSVGVVRTILEGYLSQVEIGRISGQVTATELLKNGLAAPQQAASIGAQVGTQLAAGTNAGATPITINHVTNQEQAIQFDPLAYMAPGMALMFLMYTVSHGGRTLLTEQRQGTLPRLLVTPITTTQVLVGKVLGIYLTGAAQMLILVVGSTLLFGLQWGDPLGVLALVLAAVLGAVGWGMLITAVARTPSQVASIGYAILLFFGILGGSFINLSNMPSWFLDLSKITPNAWGLNGFSTLAQGGRLNDILSPVLALIAMGLLLFALAVFLINRRGFSQR